MKYFKIIAVVLIFILNTSCKKDATNPQFVDEPVIQSYLKVGETPRVNVSRLISFASDPQYSSDDINNLLITISVNNSTYTLTPQGNGNYSAINPSLTVTAGTTYSLNLVFNKKNVSAVTIIPAKPTGYTESVATMSITQRHAGGGFSQGGLNPDPVTLSWTNGDNSYYLVLIQAYDSAQVNLIDTSAGAPPRAFKASPIQNNTSQIRPQQFQYYGMHRLILFHLNPDYATLYNNTSTNSTNLTNSSTSVVNGAGIFTGINSDTLFIDILKP